MRPGSSRSAALAGPPLGSVIWGLLAAVIVVAPMALFNLSVSESFLPTTFSAKSTGVSSLLPNLHAIYEILSVFFSTQPYFTFTAFAGCLVLFERFAQGRKGGLLPALWMLGLPLAYSTLGAVSDNVLVGAFGRYFFPLLPFMVVLGVLGIARVLRGFSSSLRAGDARIPVAALVLLLMAWPTATNLFRGFGRYLQSVGNVHRSDVEIARWLEPRLPEEAVLGVNDVGAIRYLLPNKIVDMAGIIHPEVTRYRNEARAAGRDWQEGVHRLLEENRPDYLVIFPSWFPRLPEIDPGYQVVRKLEIPLNITMGGNELAVYTTPWTRYPLRKVPDDVGGSAQQ